MEKENVWDYPRPPKLEKTHQLIQIELGGRIIAETREAYRILETSHPPTYYIHPEAVLQGILTPSLRTTYCEYKGKAHYMNLEIDGDKRRDVCWYYPSPNPQYAPIKDYLSFYPSKVDRCFVDGEEVTAQEGDFYGGWITKNIEGEMKGPPGTEGW